MEIGTGLNTRFERVDNGTVHWIDLDLPDTIELRRQFFTDTERRQMVAASVLDHEWLQTVEQRPGPYLFIAEGVLVYLTPDEVTQTLARIAARFPGALIALDTYSQRMLGQQHQLAARHRIAPWQWACDDPRSLERLGLSIAETATITGPPRMCAPSCRPRIATCCRWPIRLSAGGCGRRFSGRTPRPSDDGQRSLAHWTPRGRFRA